MTTLITDKGTHIAQGPYFDVESIPKVVVLQIVFFHNLWHQHY